MTIHISVRMVQGLRITHLRKGGLYIVEGQVIVRVDDVWYDYVAYKSAVDGKTYARLEKEVRRNFGVVL